MEEMKLKNRHLGGKDQLHHKVFDEKQADSNQTQASLSSITGVLNACFSISGAKVKEIMHYF